MAKGFIYAAAVGDTTKAYLKPLCLKQLWFDIEAGGDVERVPLVLGVLQAMDFQLTTLTTNPGGTTSIIRSAAPSISVRLQGAWQRLPMFGAVWCQLDLPKANEPPLLMHPEIWKGFTCFCWIWPQGPMESGPARIVTLIQRASIGLSSSIICWLPKHFSYAQATISCSVTWTCPFKAAQCKAVRPKLASGWVFWVSFGAFENMYRNQ